MPSLAPESECFEDLVEIVKNPRSQIAFNIHFRNQTILDTHDDEGNTLLHHAALEGSLQTASVLLERGANVNAMNEQNETPLLMAVLRFARRKSFFEISAWIKLFLEKGYNVELRDAENKMVIEYLIEAMLNILEKTEIENMNDWLSEINFDPIIELALQSPSYFIDIPTEHYHTESLAKNISILFHKKKRGSILFDRLMSQLYDALKPRSFSDLVRDIAHITPIRVKRYVFERGKKKIEVDEEGSNLLMLAAIHGHVNIVKYLLEQGFSIRTMNKAGHTALTLAIKHKKKHVVDVLLKIATHEDLTVSVKSGISPMALALESGNAEISRKLLGALMPKFNGSALFYFVRIGDAHGLQRYLLDAEQCPLDPVTLSKQSHAIGYSLFHKRLLDLGQQTRLVDEQDAQGRMILHHVVSLEYYRNLRNNLPLRLFGMSADYIVLSQGAVLSNYFNFMKVLSVYHLNINARDKEGNTPLLLSAKTPMFLITADLIARKAGVNIANTKGETPLMVAARCDYTSTVELLLNNHAEVNLVNAKGETPLMIAARCGHASTVELLLNHGADAALENQYGMTALDIAMKCRKTEVINMLKSYGEKFGKRASDDLESPAKRMKVR